MIKAIIFDMDGVLIDSTKHIWKAFNILLKDFGVHISDENIKKYLGKSLRDQIEMWKKDFNIKEDIDYREFSKKAGNLELSFYENELNDNKDLKNLLKQLKDKKIKLAVATSSLRWRAEKILDSLDVKNNFDVIITAEDVENHKPHPDIFLKAAEELNINPKNCVVIEDAADGIEAAKKGKMKAIALLTKFHEKEELEDADLIINSLKEITWDKIKNI